MPDLRTLALLAVGIACLAGWIWIVIRRTGDGHGRATVVTVLLILIGLAVAGWRGWLG